MSADERFVAVTARHGGADVTVTVPSSATSVTFGDVVVAFANELGLSLSTTRLHGATKKWCAPSGVANVTSTSVLPPEETLKKLRLMVTGSRAEEAEALERERGKDYRIRGFEEEDRRELVRCGLVPSSASGGRGGGGGSTSTSHRFGDIDALDVPDFIKPTKRQAVELLERLATDPGIVGVMDKHGWRVPKLREMPPEGKVGVSESCVLGYNVNQGAEIHLRLRTDDLRGFRDYVTIRRTLLHELAHNVHADHGPGFRELNSRLNVECARLDWKCAADSHTTRRAADAAERALPSGYIDPLDPMATTRASSGAALGGRASANSLDEMRAARLRALDVVRAAETELNRAAEDALRAAGLDTL
jgi:hypothetical protein